MAVTLVDPQTGKRVGAGVGAPKVITSPKTGQPKLLSAGSELGVTVERAMVASADGLVRRNVEFSEVGAEPLTLATAMKFGGLPPDLQAALQRVVDNEAIGVATENRRLDVLRKQRSEAALRGGRRGTVLTGAGGLTDEPLRLGTPSLVGAQG